VLSRLRRLTDRARPAPLLLAATCYLPLLLTHRGKVGADTKTYLYLDPARLMSRAAYLWDPSIGLGTVTHQNIGYLFPMGPYFWLCQAVGMPDWIAQRLWVGSIMFVAGLGLAAFLRTLRWEGNGRWVAAFAYALSPYVLGYLYKHSVILLPYAALGWLLTFTARSLRERTWRDPALFALTCLWSGGINATSLLLVLIGPGLWVLHVTFVEKEMRLRATVAPLLRIGVLTLATSLWWIFGLVMQGRYGINVLRYTETYKTVADASTAPEVLRGYGYWFFYGTDILGPWFKAAVTATQSLPALALSFGLPILAVAAALYTRFRYRVFFVGLGLAGLVLSVGAHPFDSPSPYGALFSAFTKFDSGLAMRSTPRAVPLLALACAVFLAAGVRAIAAWRPSLRVPATAAALLIIVANLSPLWMGRMIDEYLERPNEVPSYWVEAGKALTAGDATTRALEIPGIDFANYRWGATVDPVTPGLTDRDYAARELVPYGSVQTADFMGAIDIPLGDGSFDPNSYAQLLRLASVGDLVERNDLEYERYRTPRPRPMSDEVGRTIGLEPPRMLGPPTPNVPDPRAPLNDDFELSRPDSLADPSPVVIRGVANALPEVRLAPAAAPTVVSGSATGLVALAESNLLDPERAVIYSGSVTDDPIRLGRLLDQQAKLVVTDTNRKAGRRWGTTGPNDGFTETADEVSPSFDPTDNRIELFTGADGAARDNSTKTVVEPRGGLSVQASGYGNNLTFTPSDRAANAVDGDPTTAWKVGALADPRGEWIELRLDQPVTADTVQLVQADRFVNRHIAKVDLSFDGGDPVAAELGDESRGGAGQDISFGNRTFRTLRITIRSTDTGEQASYKTMSGVGFAEIGLGGRHITEVVRPPTDLIDSVGSRLAQHDLTYVFRRVRSLPNDPVLQSPELRMVRDLRLPDQRRFTVTGRARISPSLADDRIDEMFGAAPAAGGIDVVTSGRLAGDLTWRGSKAIDGDPRTAWQSNMYPEPGTSITVTAPAVGGVTLNSVTVMSDGLHSVPRKIRISADGQPDQSATLIGAVADGPRGARTELQLDHPLAVIAASFKVSIDQMDERTTRDWLTGRSVRLPIGIAELTGPGIPRTTPPTGVLPTTCRPDLLRVGDTPIGLQLNGDVATAEAGGAVDVARCATEAGPVAVSAGSTVLSAADGRTTGVDLDNLVLASTAPSPAPPSSGGTAVPAGTAPGGSAPVTGGTGPEVGDLTVDRTGRLSYELSVDQLDRPTWLVLGQTRSTGWHLTVDGRDLGPSTLINGFSNGWLLDPAVVGRSARLELEWTPQRVIWFALAASSLAAVGCLVLVVRGRRVTDAARGLPLAPRLIGWRDSFGDVLPWRGTVSATVAAGAAGAVFIGPVTGTLTMGIATFVALRTRWGWPVVRLASLATLSLAAAFVVAKEWHVGYLVDFDWPQHFEPAHTPTMIAMGLLGVECVVEALRAGWRRRTGLDP